VQIKRVTTNREMTKAFAIRLRVFVKEQGVPEDIELDQDDRRAIHLLALASGKAVGTTRVVVRAGRAKIGRMAVLKSYRGKGVGKQLLKHAITTAEKLRARKIYLHAQVGVIEFYEKLHFYCVGPVFDEAGIPHRKMVWKKTTGVRQQAIAREGEHDR
jgi:predicted GNAT family N-acyltransferase